MAYRPYPNVDRALAQVARHYPPVPVLQVSEALRPLVASMSRLRANTRLAMEASTWHPDFQMDARTGDVKPYPVGAYVLSTRRPGVVGPTS